jgi:tRNA nucleotidyltransferase/poly(A) polymerase
MADYIYLLENRLSPAQRNALRIVRELARSRNCTIFLVGGAVRDLTTGSPVRDLDVVVQGNAPKLKKDLEKAGAVVFGELDATQALFLSFAGGVRMEFSSALSVTYPRPVKPVFKPASILDDLRRRDFTANAMALSLNEGSYGLLMDPLNGVADIENRELRLVSNYGFIEDPIRLVRAARLMARLGWSLDEKTQSRYDLAKEEGYISSITDLQRGYETEEIVHEEDPLRVLKRLEAEDWMKHLAPFWTSAKVDAAGLEHLREVQTQLQMQGIQPDASAANFPLLTAKLSASEVASLKAGFVRQGFVKEIDSLDAKAKELTAALNSKAAALPSQAWKLMTSFAPEAVLWVAYTSKSAALQAKFKNFFSVWPQARNKMPYALMQEMRIVPELPGYDDLLEKLFFELMDDKLQTPEEMKAFLEPYSPPAPPPPVNLRRARGAKKEAKGAKGRGRKAVAMDAEEDLDADSDSGAESDSDSSDAHDLSDDGAASDEIAALLPDVLHSESSEDEDVAVETEPGEAVGTRDQGHESSGAGESPVSPAPPVKLTGRPSSGKTPAGKNPATPAGKTSASAAKTIPAPPAKKAAAVAPPRGSGKVAASAGVAVGGAKSAPQKSAAIKKARKAAAPQPPAKKIAGKAPAQPAAKKSGAKAAPAAIKPVTGKPAPAKTVVKASAKSAPTKKTLPAKAASKKAAPAKGRR